MQARRHSDTIPNALTIKNVVNYLVRKSIEIKVECNEIYFIQNGEFAQTAERGAATLATLIRMYWLLSIVVIARRAMYIHIYI